MARNSKTAMFAANADSVAKALIGKTIERYVAGSEHPITAQIVAAGAYEGLSGNKKEQEGMNYGPGRVYVMQQRAKNLSFNIGTEAEGTPSVVSIIGIRAATESGIELMIGPGRVSSFLEIEPRFDGVSLDDIRDLIIKGRSASQKNITRLEDGQRIGRGSGAGYARYSSNCTGVYVLSELVSKG